MPSNLKLLRALVNRTSVTAGILIFDAAIILGVFTFFAIQQSLEYDDALTDAAEMLDHEAKAVGEYAEDTYLRVRAVLSAAVSELGRRGAPGVPAQDTRWQDLRDRAAGIAEIDCLAVVAGEDTRILYRRADATAVPAPGPALGLAAGSCEQTPAMPDVLTADVTIHPLPENGAGRFLIARSLVAADGRAVDVVAAMSLRLQSKVRPLLLARTLPAPEVRLASETTLQTGAGPRGDAGAAGDGDAGAAAGNSSQSAGERLISSFRNASSPFVSFVSLPKSEVLSPWRRNRRQAITLMLGAAAILLAITAPIAFLIARPLAGLRNAVARISEGDLDQPVRAPLAFADIHQTGHGVESMRRSLRSLTSSLSQEVESKTEQLSSRNLQLALALESMAHALLMLDRDGCIVCWNQRLLAKLNLPPQMFRAGEPLKAIMRRLREGSAISESWLETLEIVSEVASRGSPCSYTLLPPDGRAIEVTHRPVPSGSVSTFVDVTEKKASVLRLASIAADATRANQSKTRFLGIMSHELRTPLNAIIGFSEIMEGQVLGPIGHSRYHEYAAGIRQSAQHLLQLINGLLDTARIESGKHTLVEAAVNLRAMLQWVELQVATPASEGLVQLRFDLPDAALTLRADETRLRQAVLNLAANAVKFTEPGGVVAVETRTAQDGALQIVVTDSGIGIDAKDIDRVQQPFEQADIRLSRRFEGAGLGLPIAKGLVELHGGTLDITSRPGAGTRVVLSFPADRLIQPT